MTTASTVARATASLCPEPPRRGQPGAPGPRGPLRFHYNRAGARSALPPRADLPAALLGAADARTADQPRVDRVLTAHPAALTAARRRRHSGRRPGRPAAGRAGVRGAHGGGLRVERLERAALHPGVGRHPVRHAAGAVPSPADAVATVLRADPLRRHHVAVELRHRGDSAGGGRGGAGVGGQRAVPRRRRRHARLSGPAAVSARGGPVAGQHLGAGALPAPARGARGDPARA